MFTCGSFYKKKKKIMLPLIYMIDACRKIYWFK
jgi:hypothetical protein